MRIGSEKNKYGHLYQSVDYVAPSVERAMEVVDPSLKDVFGKVRINGNNSVQVMAGSSYMEYLVDRKLRAKDMYRKMKDRTVYSDKAEITRHSALNTLSR